MNSPKFLQPKKVFKKETQAENFYAPIRANFKAFREEKENTEPTYSKPPQYKKARSIFRSTSDLQQFGEFQTTPSSDFEKARREFQQLEEFKRARGEFQPSSDFGTSQEEFQPSSAYKRPVRQPQQPPQPDFQRGRDEFQPAASPYKRPSVEYQPAANFESGRGEYQPESEDIEREFEQASNSIFNDDEIQPTPNSSFDEFSEYHSTPPFEPIRDEIRTPEPENFGFMEPTPPSRLDTRQVIAEHFTERPAANSFRPRPAEPAKPRPVDHFSARDAEQFGPGSFDAFSPEQIESFSSRPVESFSERSVKPVPVTDRLVNSRPEVFTPRPVGKPTESFVKENEVESFDGFSSDLSSEDSGPIRRPDPFEFHQKIASQFDGSASDDNDRNSNEEIVFSGTQHYDKDPIRVTEAPIFTDKEADAMEAPIRSETVEAEPQSRLTHRHRHFSVEEPSTAKYAIYDPVSRAKLSFYHSL